MRARLGRPSAAAEAHGRAAALSPGDAAMRLAHARALARAGRRPQALAAAQAGLALKPDAATQVGLGDVLLAIERPDLALAPARAAAAERPDDPAALRLLAACERQAGEPGAARAALDAWLRLSPDEPEALWMRSDLARATPDANHVDDLRRRTRGGAGDPRLSYALGKELEELGRHDEAFGAIAAGAATVRASLPADVEDERRRMAALRTRPPRTDTAGDSGAAPIFVVGLPRTGTSLVARILEAHPETVGLGEPPAFDRAVHDVAAAHGARDPDHARGMAATLPAAALGRAYRELVGDTGGRRAVDKRPLNGLHLAEIAAALPRAALVLVERDPQDAGWAAFKTPFNGAYPWSYDLAETGRHVAEHGRLADHWAATLGPRLLRLSYEAVVADAEGSARALLAHCGLPWDDAVLRFHESAAPATTASALQVRRPIYASSVGLWRRYENRLGPLIEALGARPR